MPPRAGRNIRDPCQSMELRATRAHHVLAGDEAREERLPAGKVEADDERDRPGDGEHVPDRHHSAAVEKGKQGEEAGDDRGGRDEHPAPVHPVGDDPADESGGDGGDGGGRPEESEVQRGPAQLVDQPSLAHDQQLERPPPRRPIRTSSAGRGRVAAPPNRVPPSAGGRLTGGSARRRPRAAARCSAAAARQHLVPAMGPARRKWEHPDRDHPAVPPNHASPTRSPIAVAVSSGSIAGSSRQVRHCPSRTAGIGCPGGWRGREIPVVRSGSGRWRESLPDCVDRGTPEPLAPSSGDRRRGRPHGRRRRRARNGPVPCREPARWPEGSHVHRSLHRQGMPKSNATGPDGPCAK